MLILQVPPPYTARMLASVLLFALWTLVHWVAVVVILLVAVFTGRRGWSRAHAGCRVHGVRRLGAGVVESTIRGVLPVRGPGAELLSVRRPRVVAWRDLKKAHLRHLHLNGAVHGDLHGHLILLGINLLQWEQARGTGSRRQRYEGIVIVCPLLLLRRRIHRA